MVSLWFVGFYTDDPRRVLLELNSVRAASSVGLNTLAAVYLALYAPVLTVQIVLRHVKSRLIALSAALLMLLSASVAVATNVTTTTPTAPTPKVWDVSLLQGNVLETMHTWCSESIEGDWKKTCSYEFWSTFAPLYGPIASFNMIMKERELSPAFLPECHHVMHALGQAAVKQVGVYAAIQLGNQACQGGYIHGALQEWTLTGSGVEGAATVCDAAKREAEVFAMCAHGLGHSIALRYPSSLTESLKVCSELLSTDVADGCVQGAVMEFSGNDHVTGAIQAALATAPKDNVTEEDRRSACNSISKPGPRGSCWKWMHMLFPKDKLADPVNYKDLCVRASDPADMRICLMTWIEQATWTINVFSPREPGVEKKIEPVFEGCAKLSSDVSIVEDCRARLIDNIWRDEPLTASTPNFCPLVRKEWQQACEKGFEQGLNTRRSA